MQKHTSPGKPMALEANTEGSASAAALLKLPAELSSPLCCSKALPSTAIQQFCHSAHQCHTSNNVSHKTRVAQVILPSSTAAADPNASTGGIITIYGSIRACHTGRNLAYQRKILQRKPEYPKLCFWLKLHITDTGVKQAKCYKKKFSRSGLGESKRAG